MSLDLLIPDFTNFDAMEQHLGSTLYCGARKTYHSKIRMMIYKKEWFDIRRSIGLGRLVRSPIDKTEPRVSESSDFRSVTDSKFIATPSFSDLAIGFFLPL